MYNLVLKYEPRSLVTLDVCDHNGKVVRNIITTECDVVRVIDWIDENRKGWTNESSDDYYHNLGIAFSRKDPPGIFIGKVDNDVRIYSSQPKFDYPIDFKRFVDDVLDLDRQLGNTYTKTSIVEEWDRGNEVDWRSLPEKVQRRYLRACLDRTGLPTTLKHGEYVVDGTNISTKAGLYVLLGEVFFGKRGYFGQDPHGLNDCITAFRKWDIEQSPVVLVNFSNKMQTHVHGVAEVLRDNGFKVTTNIAGKNLTERQKFWRGFHIVAAIGSILFAITARVNIGMLIRLSTSYLFFILLCVFFSWIICLLNGKSTGRLNGTFFRKVLGVVSFILLTVIVVHSIAVLSFRL